MAANKSRVLVLVAVGVFTPVVERDSSASSQASLSWKPMDDRRASWAATAADFLALAGMGGAVERLKGAALARGSVSLVGRLARGGASLEGGACAGRLVGRLARGGGACVGIAGAGASLDMGDDLASAAAEVDCAEPMKSPKASELRGPAAARGSSAGIWVASTSERPWDPLAGPDGGAATSASLSDACGSTHNRYRHGAGTTKMYDYKRRRNQCR